MKTKVLITTVLFLGSAAVSAASVQRSYRTEQKFTVAANGLFVIENPVGDVTVQGADVDGVHASILKTITGKNADAVEEGRKHTTVIVGGDDRARVVRSTVPPPGPSEWTASVQWQVRVPRTANVRVISRTSRRITITGMQGAVQVKNFNGAIMLESNTGPVVAESVNGSMLYRTHKPRANVTLTSVNGSVTASVAPDADIRWVADTVKGDVRTNLPARGAFFGTMFRGSLNAPGGPTITTATLMGHVQLISLSGTVRTVQSLRTTPASPAPKALQASRAAATRDVVTGTFEYSTNLGDVRVQEVRGNADIFTGAGEVLLGAVSGKCKVRSLGGPLQLGEVLGRLSATTRAGDILVDSARSGGMIRTQGGRVQLLYSAGTMEIYSGGGDIAVRQAAGPVDATTRSGDISIGIDPGSKTEVVEAHTGGGNVILNVTPSFAADIDAVLLTDNPEADIIHSDLPGLSISKDQYQGKTRIRATGKVNGGGEKVMIRATGGDIRISTRPLTPTVITRR